MKLRRFTALFLCICLAVLSFAGCGAQPGGAQPGGAQPGGAQPGGAQPAGAPGTTYQRTITIAPALFFTSQCVQGDSGGTAKSVFNMVFNTLVDFDTITEEFIPSLAVSWTQLDDTKWEFNLREGVRWHDGSYFTAEDVRFTVERGLTMGAAAGRLNTIESVTVVDDHTVHFHLTMPDNDLVYKLSEPNTSIISSNAFATLSPEEANQIGTGPFKYVEWVVGDFVSLVRNEDYWGGVKPTEQIIIRNIPEASSRLIALQTGEVDIAMDPPAIDLHHVENDPNLTLLQITGSVIRHFNMNANVEPFTDIRVRQAIAHAINRDDLLILVYEGHAIRHHNVMHPICSFYYPGVTYYQFDLDRSRALLAEAGLPNGFETTIFTSAGSVQRAVATVLQAQLAEINVRVNIESLETATFNAGAAQGGTFPMAVDGWGGHVIGPDNAVRNAFHTGGAFNRSNIDVPSLDNLIDQALSTSDRAERARMYAEIQQFVIDYANWIPVSIELINVGKRQNVRGWRNPHGVFHHWYDLYVVIE